MQPLARTSLLDPGTGRGGTAYGTAQVATALLTPGQQEKWIVERVSQDGAGVLQDLSALVVGSGAVVEHDTSRAVRRTCHVSLRGDAVLQPWQDLLRIHHQVRALDGGWLDFSMGLFVLLPPRKNISPSETILDIDGADLSQLLVDAPFLQSFGAAAGANYIGVIGSIAASYGGVTPIPVSIPDFGLKLPAALSWDAGTTRLKAVNDLLQAINYFPAWIDETGTLRSSPIPDWNTVQPAFVFDTTQGQSNVKAHLHEDPDPSLAFNIATVEVADHRRGYPPFSVSYANTSPLSRVSTVNWHPKGVVIKDSKITDVATALARARAEVQAGARVYSPLTLPTLPWSVGQDNDVYGVNFQTKDELLTSFNYVEARWSHVCKAGASTTHVLNRLVPTI